MERLYILEMLDPAAAQGLRVIDSGGAASTPILLMTHLITKVCSFNGECVGLCVISQKNRKAGHRSSLVLQMKERHFIF